MLKNSRQRSFYFKLGLKIKRKYKMMNDYPFLMSPYLSDIKNNGIIKCIYKNLRQTNHKELKKEIEKYKDLCKDEKNYNPELSIITPDDTDNDESEEAKDEECNETTHRCQV